MKILKIASLTILVAFLLLASAAIGGYYYIQMRLPTLKSIGEYNPNVATVVFSEDGQKIGSFYTEKRTIVPLSMMPEYLVRAFIATEDARFFEHDGIDYKGVSRALFKDLKEHRIVQGGSTITQQLVKSFFLTPERSLSRKVKEAIIAYRIENNLSKQEILYLYLNQIYFGNGAYGVETASETYFGKEVNELNLAEAAILAGLPKAPSRYSPYTHFDAAIRRQRHVLTRMLEEGFITREEMEGALDYPVKLARKEIKSMWVAPYFTEYIRKYVSGKYGEKMLYREGLHIYTTLNVEMQKAANKAVQSGLKRHDRRRGFRGPIDTIMTEEGRNSFIEESEKNLRNKPIRLNEVYKALVDSVNVIKRYVTVKVGNREGRIYFTDMNWARLYNPSNDPDGGRYISIQELLKEGDIIYVRVKRLPDNSGRTMKLSLEQEPLAQASLLAMDPFNGYIKALVGGSDYNKSEFNRAIQSKRQPGSAYKPVIYAAALDSGYTPATIVLDSPLVFKDISEGELPWKPKNYEEKFYGPTTVRVALEHSRNVVTIKILKDIGIKKAVSYAKRLGIVSPLNQDLSMALGSSSLSLMEMVTAYATFDASGKRPKPIFITKITDKHGNTLEENIPEQKEALSPQTAYIVTNLLQGVVKEGTGRRASVLRRPVAGKTGTTNNLKDAWFIGYTPDLVAGTWIGYDEERPLGKRETGARAALPIWLKFMKDVTKGTPIRNFTVPEGIVFAKIDAKTGLLPGPSTKKTIFEAFKDGTVPNRVSKEKNSPESERFFEMDTGRQ